MGEWLHAGLAGNRAYLAAPEAGVGPGVLVLHAWWGLTSDFTDVCDRLAENGFVALAPSSYAGGETTDTIAGAEELVAVHDSDPNVAKSIALAAIDHLCAMPAAAGDEIGIIGFSLGA